MHHSGCYLRLISSCWCPVCPRHNLASHEEFLLRDISPCDQNIMLILTSFDVVHYLLLAPRDWIKLPELQKICSEL
jgi:hypothetical protein